MKYSQLARLIQKGESQTLDFKRKITKASKIAKTLVSFANTKGGKILVGVDDDQQIIGIDPEEERFIINEAAKFYCEPALTLTFLAIEDTYGKNVLVVTIPESNEKPHHALFANNEKKVYVRMNDKSILASKILIKNMQKGINEHPTGKLNPQQERLITFLQKNEKITVKQYASAFNVSERRAKRILFEMTQSGFLLSHDFDKE
ncbi:MAG: ATP-binding protein, partial [Bacteroidota bacterium]